MTRMALGGLALALAGCVSAYKDPPASPALAEVTFSRHETVPRWGHTQILHAVSDERCTSRNHIKQFAPLMAPTPLTFRIDAGERRYFYAETTRSSGSAVGFTDTTCANVASFVPAAGRAYTLEQRLERQGCCAVEVLDAATRAPAPELTTHPFPRSCDWINWGF